MRFDTRLVHAGAEPTPGTGDLVPPVHLSVTYERSAQDPLRYFYGRGENPTREALESCLAALEDVRFATAYTSGQAAAEAALSLLSPGQRVVAGDDVYGGTHALFDLVRARGVTVDQVDLADPGRCQAVLADDAAPLAMVWLETPSNPLLKVTDVAAVARHAHRRGALVLVDNTLASPALQQPLSLGADVTLYSTTKFLAGHLDVLGGALVYDDPRLHERLVAHRTTVGTAPGGADCFLVQRGLKTLSLRMARQVQNAQAVVAALGAEPAVCAIHYPGLPGHPQHDVAVRQMRAPGALVSFAYRGDPVQLMERVRLFAAAVSLGGVRSLIECPALMTHRPVPRETRLRVGVGDDLVRLSMGIEDPADLVEDLIRALRARPA
ncbi:trans-sulfuration enzyme family protein [Micromonospora olivasterospora]|uniref:homocysteine desulfhydrase n=1 Tax=Micromonospora olivasterospora TaxID=1880 RepID=A0A562I325_MICOL|nr:PLP-dependent aspartate aminotransferase family protein [Micromonospora olivasterospora]TWH65098.1 cystathionine gamma-lyase [Micromonospora olivasterospora]